MEYQKINLLDNTPNQLSKFRTKNWVKINDESRGTYDSGTQIIFKSSMLKSSLCDYSDAYIIANGTIAITNNETAADSDNKNKKLIFQNCAPFSNCIGRINNTQENDAQDSDIVMAMYNLIEYNDNYSKTPGLLWKYCMDEPTVDDGGDIADFKSVNSTTDSFKIKEKITGKTGNNGRKNVATTVPLNYLSNFWRTLEVPLINCKFNLDLNWSKDSALGATNVANQEAPFSITDTKLYVSAETLSTQDDGKLLEQLKFSLERTIN